MVGWIGHAGDQVPYLLRVEEALGEQAELALQDREHVEPKGHEVVLGLLDPDKRAEEVVGRINGDGLQDCATPLVTCLGTRLNWVSLWHSRDQED